MAANVHWHYSFSFFCDEVLNAIRIRMFKSSPISANFGFAPVCSIAFMVIIHVKGVVITSSPGPISRDLRES